jgi:hypothetical protein
MSKYLKLNENNMVTDWPTVWEYLDDGESDNSVEIKDAQALMNLTNESDQWHCPKWEGEAHTFVLNPLLVDAYKDFLKTGEQCDAEVYLNDTDYVVMKLYEDALGINRLSDDDKAKYIEIVAERQRKRDLIRQAEAEIDAKVRAELEAN